MGLTSTAFASHHEGKGEMKKAEAHKEVKSEKDQKAEADAALKRVEDMTKKNRADNKEHKKEKKK